ncbi:N-acetylmuramic acid 6-phosphate etherase [Vibrio breoganii]|uniref:N-acetylmuramic acid 6-phosphate etherase n=1 Tax=Vibrio breoganii TaxID=553239 RepID=UPI000C862675|nr:N-acetylmuramic acid 6-phosphate etherase [Vibrio breoganii]PMG82301.1 N-acetylmuramic acid 6-phosphate etherase [Vibrio breoganii]PML81762.1 N-acetylmuramic acid 6-phosphate etherase [Vibrio breoganii]PMM46082.1 N-acetylmuramic acid 6-phosphate etherase [Vibrio breoganii]PMM88876.1 N-acetylmuramic acid 6-phosphate etherase [Vibrio breoganii]PMO92764.1 N-acetylmuramic acid 6-phosphate etherase [Vibrio breoganii]
MSQSTLIDSLSKLVSENRNPETMDIDTLSCLEIVEKMNQADAEVPRAIQKELPHIAKAVEVICEAFQQGGRLIYLGAGTSGRLGVLDASECPPTFSVDDNVVIGLIAGGKEAMFRAQEGAEDSLTLAEQDLKQLNLTDKDVVVGIAASGRTPYVIGALNYANTLGAYTVSLSCNPDSAIASLAKTAISPVVGPEVLTGSTRLKAGTAQKLVLNMLSTASMIKLGKAYQNLMVDVKPSNEKLNARAVRIIMQATECSEQQAEKVLFDADMQVKLAIMMQLTGQNKQQAQQQLDQQKGFIRG